MDALRPVARVATQPGQRLRQRSRVAAVPRGRGASASLLWRRRHHGPMPRMLRLRLPAQCCCNRAQAACESSQRPSQQIAATARRQCVSGTRAGAAAPRSQTRSWGLCMEIKGHQSMRWPYHADCKWLQAPGLQPGRLQAHCPLLTWGNGRLGGATPCRALQPLPRRCCALASGGR